MLAFLLFAVWCLPARAWEQDGLRLRGRMIGRYQIRDEDRKYGRWTDTLSVHRARFDGRWEPTESLRLGLEFDLADGFEMEDVYVRYEFHRAFRLQLGHFKKPFSRKRLTRRWDLVIPRRGLLDRHVTGRSLFGGFGGRDMGAMVSGRAGKKVKFRWFLGVFDGEALQRAFHVDPDEPDEPNVSHRDYVARLQLRVIKGLVLAVHYGHKQAGLLLAPGEEMERTFNLFGGDVRFRLAGLELMVEGVYGDNPNAAAGHKIMGGHATVSYEIRLTDEISLIPAFMAEYMDPDDEAEGGDALRLAGALNLDVGKHTRVVLAVEGGSGKYSWEVAEYITPEQAVAVGMTPREVPTRVILQLNVSI